MALQLVKMMSGDSNKIKEISAATIVATVAAIAAAAAT